MRKWDLVLGIDHLGTSEPFQSKIRSALAHNNVAGLAPYTNTQQEPLQAHGVVGQNPRGVGRAPSDTIGQHA